MDNVVFSVKQIEDRKIFYVDVGNMSPKEAADVLKQIMEKWAN